MRLRDILERPLYVADNQLMELFPFSTAEDIFVLWVQTQLENSGLN